MEVLMEYAHNHTFMLCVMIGMAALIVFVLAPYRKAQEKNRDEEEE